MKRLAFVLLLSFSNVCLAYQYYEERGEAFFRHQDELNRPRNQKVFVFSPRYFAWAAYDADGDIVGIGGASGGKDYCPDIGSSCRTSTGSYRVFLMRGSDCVSTKFPVATNEREAGGGPMPYCMFFNGGYAIHGSDNVPKGNASHGCIRVTPSAAEWLNTEFVEIGTKVIVLPY